MSDSASPKYTWRNCMLVTVLTTSLLTASQVVHGQVSTGATAGTSTVVSIPDPPPTTPVDAKDRPKGATLWRESLRALTNLRQLHAEGTVTDGFGTKDAVSLIADCDSRAHRVHMLQQLGAQGAIEEIVVGKRMWARVHNGSSAWSPWQDASQNEAIVTYVFIYFLPQSCPQEYLGISKRGTPPNLENRGLVLVDGVPTWHLRAHFRVRAEPAVLNVNIDRTTYLWKRYAWSQTARKKKDSIVEDTHYSRLNVPVDIEPPVVVPTATSTPTAVPTSTPVPVTPTVIPVTPGPLHLQSPARIAVDGRGVAYVAEPSVHEIVAIGPQGSAIARWSNLGQGSNHLRALRDVAADADGNFYVADTELNRVEKFSPDGKFLAAFGQTGSSVGQLRRPSGVAVGSDGYVYVADIGNQRMEIFDPAGRWHYMTQSFPRRSNWTEVDVDRGINYYLLDSGTGIITTGDTVGGGATWGRSVDPQAPALRHAEGLAIDTHKHLYVADTGNNRIEVLVKPGRSLASWTTQGWKRPQDVALDAHGDIYVADTGNNRVVKLSPDGQVLAIWQ
jgi:sugar lactone lactonase YvrE